MKTLITAVVIDLKNPNALIAMAIVSQNANNPYIVICEYIKYCIFTCDADTITLAGIKDAVGKEFGLYLPYNITVNCLSIIESEGFVSQTNHQIKRVGSFDTDAFDRERESYRETETALIGALQDFVAKYGKDWTFEFAREQLIKVLDKNGLAYDIFLHKDSARHNGLSTPNPVSMLDELLPDEEAATENGDIEKQPLYSDEFFVGRFIQKTISTDNAKKDYLQRICEGLMLCEGAYQLPSIEAGSTAPQIKNTEFYFDTRLLLRFIGCAGEAAVEAAKELVALIQDKGGRIYYYPQTLEEMNRAFDEAINNLSNNIPPYDEEMRIYALRENNSAPVLRVKKANLEKELSSANIFLRPHEQFSDSDRIQFGFSISDLQQFMLTHLKWDVRTIENDAYSLWETHMRRRGDYSEYCGTNSKLPVFVTTNSRLIGIVLAYREARSSCKEINQWKSNRLPVITDVRLMCRLWVPSEHLKRLSLLNLTANAVAAQRPTRRYLDTVRDIVVKLEQTAPEYTEIPLPEFFDDNVTDVILEQTGGDEGRFNVGTFASSLAELSEWKARDQELITKQVCSERDELSEKYNNQTQGIIDSAILENKNNLGWIKIIIYLVLGWNIIAPILCAGISAAVSYKTGDWNLLWITAIPMVFAGIEAISATNFVKKGILKVVFPRIDAAYNKRIIKSLRQSEMPYKDDIIEQSKSQSELWRKCISLIDE